MRCRVKLSLESPSYLDFPWHFCGHWTGKRASLFSYCAESRALLPNFSCFSVQKAPQLNARRCVFRQPRVGFVRAQNMKKAPVFNGFRETCAHFPSIPSVKSREQTPGPPNSRYFLHDAALVSLQKSSLFMQPPPG